MFITLEGIDGSGKTSVGQKLTAKIIKNFPQLAPIFTREPGGFSSPSAEKIRDIILEKESDLSAKTEAILYSAARRIHVESTILPILEQKRVIICDRYIDSFYAYQGFGDNLGYEWTKNLTQLIVNVAIPDLTFYLDLPLELSKDRRLKRHSKHINQIDLQKREFFERVVEGYKIINEEHKDRVVVIDASKPIDEVIEKCYQLITNHSKFKELLEFHGRN